MQNLSKPIVGIVEHVTLVGCAEQVPAKVDTGADSSAIWATDIALDAAGVLTFCLFGEGSAHYTGEVHRRTDFSVSLVRSSNGVAEVRYRTHFSVKIAGKQIKARFNLSDRSMNTYKILIGRRTISNKFLVDVAQGTELLPERERSRQLTEELRQNPQAFHHKYITQQKGEQS